jgi:glutamine synthetase
LSNRIIDDSIDSIRSYVKLHEKENMDALDEVMWNSIADIKFNVMKDTLTKKSLFTQIKEALESKDFEKASNLQLELKHNMEEIQQLYIKYKKNIY